MKGGLIDGWLQKGCGSTSGEGKKAWMYRVGKEEGEEREWVEGLKRYFGPPIHGDIIQWCDGGLREDGSKTKDEGGDGGPWMWKGDGCRDGQAREGPGEGGLVCLGEWVPVRRREGRHKWERRPSPGPVLPILEE